jgi:hypothetical protein
LFRSVQIAFLRFCPNPPLKAEPIQYGKTAGEVKWRRKVTFDSESMESIGGVVPGLKGLLSVGLYFVGSSKGYRVGCE